MENLFFVMKSKKKKEEEKINLKIRAGKKENIRAGKKGLEEKQELERVYLKICMFEIVFLKH